MDRYKLDLVSAGRDFNKIRMAITSGFFFHAARKDPQVCAVFPLYSPVTNLPKFSPSAQVLGVVRGE